VSLSIDEELRVVPFDVVSEPTTLDSLQVLVKGVSIGPVDINLGEHVEGEPILFLHSRFDLRVRTRLLSSKLVAWERSNSETISAVFFVQSLELMVVGVGQPSVGGDVDDNDNVTLIFPSKVDHLLLINIQGFELIDRSGRCRVALF